MQIWWIIGILILGVAVILGPRLIGRVVIYDFQRGVRYQRGRLRGIVAPGVYWFLRPVTTITVVDMRPTSSVVGGQEIMSADHVPVKLSAVVRYRVVDPAQALQSSASYTNDLYTAVQLALRELIGSRTIDALLAERQELDQALLERVQPAARQFGLEVEAAQLRDLTLSGEMKRTFAQLVKTQKEAQIALEKARGESAVLRHLANAARLFDQHPALLHLRTLQALGDSSGHTVIISLPPAPRDEDIVVAARPAATTPPSETGAS